LFNAIGVSVLMKLSTDRFVTSDTPLDPGLPNTFWTATEPSNTAVDKTCMMGGMKEEACEETLRERAEAEWLKARSMAKAGIFII
jgi:hypothetical protein